MFFHKPIPTGVTWLKYCVRNLGNFLELQAPPPNPNSADATNSPAIKADPLSGSFSPAQLFSNTRVVPHSIYGGDPNSTSGGDRGVGQARIRMVYTAALLFGKALAVPAEHENVADMMAAYSFRLASLRQEGSSGRRGSVDSCDDSENTLYYPNMDAGLEHEERVLQQDLTRRIERCLTEAKTSVLQCKVLLLPRQMTARVGRDVLRSSTDEPCGLRGASIRVYVETKDGLKSLGCVLPDSSVTPTFELSVLFKADNDGWKPLKHIFESRKVLKLRPEYKLVKRKLYSSASPVIHEFS